MLRATRLFAGLAGDLEGDPDHRAPLILLHGLTFDRAMWRPALAELRKIDPGRQVLTLDLPGHGGSPAWPSYDTESLAASVHRAAREAGLRGPVIAGHCISAVIATVYAAKYRARGVINVDQPLRIESFASLVQSLAGQLLGPGFPAAWDRFEADVGIELLEPAVRRLLRSSRNLWQDLVTGYWRELLDRPAGEPAMRINGWLAAVRASKLPYLVIAGHDAGPDYRDWLSRALPQARITIWPGAGHFPHLVQPGDFARSLAATAALPSGPASKCCSSPPQPAAIRPCTTSRRTLRSVSETVRPISSGPR
jgi:pimeloyl-ACP methyl ester carboxylesterase